MRCKAEGQLRHHFWGEYCATIGLLFDNALQAGAVVATGALDGEAWGTWKQSGGNPKVLVWHGNNDQFAALKTVLVRHGADGSKVDSLRYRSLYTSGPQVFFGRYRYILQILYSTNILGGKPDGTEQRVIVRHILVGMPDDGTKPALLQKR